ncbi:MAG: UvrD-helicase domain-containing protein, partial [Elusimicrobiota bacterium]
MKNVTLYSASAGTGKTYTICEEIAKRIKAGLDPKCIMAVTFTKKAAAELKSRVQKALIEKGFIKEAAAMELAAIGTLHSVGQRFINKFALRLGLSPDLDVLADLGIQGDAVSGH